MFLGDNYVTAAAGNQVIGYDSNGAPVYGTPTQAAILTAGGNPVQAAISNAPGGNIIGYNADGSPVYGTDEQAAILAAGGNPVQTAIMNAAGPSSSIFSNVWLWVGGGALLLLLMGGKKRKGR